ncbi:Uroporphyrinogen decarboxylase [Roseimaritima multifibrata]|uniref:Uroporphyrinogen decarboxylase n=1 Tax=Roseimaritima multifibrata TaxID=1930274 RepID=A0A517MCB0_9BACT|nr:uroporphyrinogen decarboxylase [Roseimaritima multifibrata]QDS92530.1 Uroporphyrinogen decarboxylase [Roseimaritima multifibrata]
MDPDFGGLRVAALQSRRPGDMARLIEKHNGVAYVSPSMREVPIEPNRPAIDFAYRVMTGEITYVILLTGVGFRQLIKSIERHVDLQQFLDSLSDITTVCRGPKPVAAMREFGLKPTFKVGEPNTWRELLQLVDSVAPVQYQTVAVQEYGITNTSLIAGLEARGGQVLALKVYGWEYPEDTSALEQNVRAICAGDRDVLLVTSGHQVVNMLRMAEHLKLTDRLRTRLRSMVVGSIGPTTTEMLQECELTADFEPPHPKMGHLVVEAAKRCRTLGEYKKVTTVMDPVTGERIPHPSQESLFMRACRGESTERTPIWLMRQAGRYMQEYREVRAKQSFLELCKKPELCSEVMCTAVDRLGVDAAIIFSDLLPILEPMGFDLEFVKGDGPVIHNPIRSPNEVDRVQELEDVSSLDFVFETVRQTRADLPQHLPLIGFAGSPFTLASYAIEGGGSRQYVHTKQLMHTDAGAWHSLMGKLARSVVRYLNAQIAAGAQCVQLFDSWAGCLSPIDYGQFVLPHMKQIFEGITPGVPVINFATGNPELLPLLRGDRRTVVGVDWRIPLDTAWQRIGHDRPVQGNLDPAVLLGDPEQIRLRASEVLAQAAGRPGHIFNLGHGVLQQTPVENVIALVEYVKATSGS